MSAIDPQSLIVAADAASSSTNSAVNSGQAETLGTVEVPVTLENANAMALAGEQFITASPEALVRLDMKNVEATSVAVAVALAWLATASQIGKELRLSNLSSDFTGVIEFSGITSMFAEHTSNVG